MSHNGNVWNDGCAINQRNMFPSPSQWEFRTYVDLTSNKHANLSLESGIALPVHALHNDLTHHSHIINNCSRSWILDRMPSLTAFQGQINSSIVERQNSISLHMRKAGCFYQWTGQGFAVRAKVTVMTFALMYQNDRAKIQPLLSSRTQLSIMMTVPFSHVAPVQPVKQWQRKSPFLSSQRTVPLGLQGLGEHWLGIS